MVELITSKTCAVCAEMKAALKLAGHEWCEIDNDRLNLHDGWREDDSCRYRAGLALNDEFLPVFFVDGRHVAISEAVKVLSLGPHLKILREKADKDLTCTAGSCKV